MNRETQGSDREAADRVLEMAEEVEASGEAILADSELDRARAALHAWVDSLTGVVVTPAFGRVTVIHEGRQSTISSPDLPFLMSVGP